MAMHTFTVKSHISGKPLQRVMAWWGIAVKHFFWGSLDIPKYCERTSPKNICQCSFNSAPAFGQTTLSGQLLGRCLQALQKNPWPTDGSEVSWVRVIGCPNINKLHGLGLKVTKEIVTFGSLWTVSRFPKIGVPPNHPF